MPLHLGMTEFTYEEPRVQVFFKDVNDDNYDKVLITMMKKTGSDDDPPCRCLDYVKCSYKLIDGKLVHKVVQIYH